MPDVRRALLVGIDDYEDNPLYGCVADAEAMATALKHHQNGELNFTTVTHTSENDEVTRAYLRERLSDLFTADDNADLLFYFSGHGAVSRLGVELVTVDYQAPSSWGLSLNDLAHLVNASPARSVTLILDCCFSGAYGQHNAKQRAEQLGRVSLSEGVTLLAASKGTETAEEVDGRGEFTRVLLDGLDGAAANIFGHVTGASLHVLAEAAFTSAWGQHPVLQSHSLGSPVLRNCTPIVDPVALRRAKDIFAVADDSVVLPKSLLAAGSQVVAAGSLSPVEVMAVLAYTQAGLVEWSSESDADARVRLTVAGRHVHSLVCADRV